MPSNGFVLIDKQPDWTSFDVVAKLRRYLHERCIGHAGTLDPFATGLLLVAVGRPSTRELQHLVGLDKVYEAVFVLGQSSTTDDLTGELAPQHISPSNCSLEQINASLRTFLGEIDQVPPTYAAIKINGKKLYELARAGTPTLVKPRRVTIFALDLLSISDDHSHLQVRLHCSSGTYVRSIARDLGALLGTGGYVESLRRTHIGPFSVSDAHPISAWESEAPPPLLKNEEIFAKLTDHRGSGTLFA